jgi:glycosyltransferase involved in cell wall biosynthesis
VFVFPSLLDTFGIVMLEANACGTPVAAYPVTGPLDVIKNNINGYMDHNLNTAIIRCLHINRVLCQQHCQHYYTWKKSAHQFIEGLLINF